MDIKIVYLDEIEKPSIMPLYIKHNTSNTSREFVAIGDAVARDILDIDLDTFNKQLPEARNANAQVIGWLEGVGRTAIHFVGSTVPDHVSLGFGTDNPKNMFIPSWSLTEPVKIHRVFVAYFINANPSREVITSARVAGWLGTFDADELGEAISEGKAPSSFYSGLATNVVPVTHLKDMRLLPKFRVSGG